MEGIAMYLSIIPLNVNGLNSTIKKHRQTADWIKKRDNDLLPTRNVPC
jgi:exonuclease III